jgi:hypothetical protein
VEHAGEDEIIGILCGAGRLSDAVLARNALTYCSHFEKMSAASLAGKTERTRYEASGFKEARQPELPNDSFYLRESHWLFRVPGSLKT